MTCFYKNSIRLFLFLLVFYLFVSADFSLAEDAQITLSSKVDKSRITIGDLITYTVTVTHQEDIRVEMPGLGANLGGFEIRDYHVYEPKKKDDKIVSEVDYTVSTFFTGEFEIPPLTILYFTKDDTTANSLTTEKIKIVVESVKSSEAGDIRDIKPPVFIPRNWWYLVRWFILGVTIIALVIAGYVVYRKKKSGKSLFSGREEPRKPPHDIAYEQLEMLVKSDLLGKGEIKQFYIEISEIIRQYIEGRYFIIAMEMTTTEVMNDLAAADMAGDDYQLFQQYLERCDLVKFAKVIPSEEENDEVIRMAYDIIDRTKIILAEPVHEENEDKLSESSGEQMTPKGDGDQEIVTESDVVNEKPVEEIEKGGDV